MPPPTIADVGAPITPESITAEGQVNLQQSAIGGVQIDSASLDGKYASQVGDVAKLQVSGPDLKVDASGRVALDRTTVFQLEVSRRTAGPGGDFEAGGAAGDRRRRSARRYRHRQCVDAADDGSDGRQQRRLQRQQSARRQQQLHGHRSRSDLQEHQGRGHEHRYFRRGGRAADQRPDGDDHLRESAHRVQDQRQGKDTGARRDRQRHPASRPSGNPLARAGYPHSGGRVAHRARQRRGHSIRRRHASSWRTSSWRAATSRSTSAVCCR